MRIRRHCLIVALFAPLAAAWADPVFSAGIRADFLMDREPEEVPLPPDWKLRPEQVPLLRRALAHPESEMKRQAAEAIAQVHRYGYAEAAQAAIPELLTILASDTVHPAARHAAAHALIVLDSRSSAAALMDASQKHGKDLRQLVEPALARWGYAAMQPVWHRRIASVKTPRRELVLAIEGLGEQRDAAALEGLLALAMAAQHPSDVRLAAARAAGRVASQGLEARTGQLLDRGRDSMIDRLCAASLIAHHSSDRSIELRQELGTDSEPAVAGDALRSLFATDPKLVLPVAESALQNSDANVRRVAIDTYCALPTPERIRTLSLKLNDPHPQLRGLVRDAFHDLSRDASLDGAIRQSAIAILNQDDWRGQEQAALLLGALDEEGVAPRLIELLSASRPEVMIAAAWSLKSLAIPDTATAVQSFAREKTTPTRVFPPDLDQQLAHLFELLGRLKSAPAAPLLEVYLPKTDNYGPESRAAAVWALGGIYEEQTNEPLAKKLLERALDTMSTPPELFQVRRAAVLSLGRMRARNQVAGLKRLLGDSVEQDLMELTIRHAIRQITGEVLPIAPPQSLELTGWFLEPPLHPKGRK